jgi:hypothetical protein
LDSVEELRSLKLEDANPNMSAAAPANSNQPASSVNQNNPPVAGTSPPAPPLSPTSAAIAPTNAPAPPVPSAHPPPPSPEQQNVVTVSQDPRFAKYFKMVKLVITIKKMNIMLLLRERKIKYYHNLLG